MGYKYLYIDDNSIENAAGIITGLEDEGLLKIDFDNPKGKWEEERERITSKDFTQYDGLILDLNLEEMPNKDHIHSLYKGSSLAQEIRNISKAGEIKEIPIILLSATVNLDKYFDKTNEDLFDLIISRDQLGDIFIPIRHQMVALAGGYKSIEKCKGDLNFSNLFKSDVTIEDIRFLGEIKSIFEFPIHTISNFILKNLLNRSGILISQKLLATRLGIDIKKSKGWENVIKHISTHAYTGVFSEGWERWWMSGINHWWSKELECESSLRSMKAKDKVKVIAEKLQLKELYPIEKAEKSKSESFWTNCAGSEIPIDTIDGLLIANQDNIFPWQDKYYISIDEALKPTGKEKWKKISPSEEFKLEQLKKHFPNERPK